MLRRLGADISGSNCVPLSLLEAAESLGLSISWRDVTRLIPQKELVTQVPDLLIEMISLANMLGMDVSRIVMTTFGESIFLTPEKVEIDVYPEDQNTEVGISFPAIVLLSKVIGINRQLINHAEVLDGNEWRNDRLRVLLDQGWIVLATLEMVKSEA
jgi:hypothetical protein